jgi:recombinational DNA repair protein (RecF pathway)
MAGETIKTSAICLSIRPWSKTSHIVSWLTSRGKINSIIKGAVRPKSQFLGQYDLNYTCSIVYYARAHGELHALRECVPENLRTPLRGDYRLLQLAEYFRYLISETAPNGPECEEWFKSLNDHLDKLCADARDGSNPVGRLSMLLNFELKHLELSGLLPDFSNYDRDAPWSPFSLVNGTFCNNGPHAIRISRETSEILSKRNFNISSPRVLDAARVIGVFYMFHMDYYAEIRRNILKLIS